MTEGDFQKAIAEREMLELKHRVGDLELQANHTGEAVAQLRDVVSALQSQMTQLELAIERLERDIARLKRNGGFA